MIRWNSNPGVLCVPYSRNPRQHWLKKGTQGYVLLGVPSLSRLPSHPDPWGHLGRGRTFEGIDRCHLSKSHQHWVWGSWGHLGQKGQAFSKARAPRGHR